MNGHLSSPSIKRRSALAAIAATPLAATSASAFQGPPPKTPDPLPGWMEEWKRVENAWKELPEDTVEADMAWSERERLSLLLCNTKATTIEGASARFEYFKEDSVSM
jgi:hypothetical protein